MAHSDTSSDSIGSSLRPPPPGPDFNDQNGLLNESITEEYIHILSSENTETIRQYDEQSTGFFVLPDVVQHIFTICARLRLPDNVRYHALDIFDRYMSLQSLYSYEAIARSEKRNQQKKDDWSNIFTTMSRQLTLRMCSAIQIASKIQSFHDSLSKTDVRKALMALGFPFTEETILKSELRVLQILNFDVKARKSPAHCVESYLSILVRKYQNLQDRIEYIHQYALFTLDFVFLNRDAVYTTILKAVHANNPVVITKERIRRVAQDYCLLGIAACLVGVICTFGETVKPAELLPYLSQISLISEADIGDAVNGILTVMAVTV